MIQITEELQTQLVVYRRNLHENPELSMQEVETTKKIKQWLTNYQIDILDFPIEVGVIAEVKGEQPGPTIAIRADIDALPIEEQSDVEFVSINPGIMHACGHDFHTSSILGTAILLQQNRHLLKGTVRIIFQPSEETAQGAEYMANAGVLQGVSAIFGMHNKPDLPVGTIGVKPGPLMASVDRFELDIIGVGGHAGIPESTVDPIIISSQIVSAFQSIVSRNISPSHNSVLSVTKLTSGNTWNVIPEKAELEGTVRTFQQESRELIPVRMKALAEGIAESYGAKADFRWYPYLPTVNNDDRFTEVLQQVGVESGFTVIEAEAVPAGEDFAFYQERIPGYFVWVGVEGSYGWHHPKYRLNEGALPVAATYFANLCVKVLEQWK